MTLALAVSLVGASLALAGGRATPAPQPPPLGTHPRDVMPMGEVPVLQHLAASLREGLDESLAVLLTQKAPPFVTAPDPSAHFQAIAALDRGPQDGEPLRVLSFNTALLDRSYLLGLQRVQMPMVPARRSVLPGVLLKDDWDILLLQEVWDWSDVMRLAEAAEREGYVWFAGSKRRHKQHGLMILVRGNLIDGAQDRTEGQFADRRRIERWPGPNIKRGYLTWSFTHAPTGRPIRVATAHLQSFPEWWSVRTLQARQVALDLAASPPDTLVILGADLNAGPYYPEDQFGMDKGRAVDGWWANSVTWPAIQHYGDLVDLRTVGEPLGDIPAMHAMPEWNTGWAKRPLNGDCHMLPPGVFTASDCNRLYFRSYGGTEYPARLDHLFMRAPADTVGIAQTGLSYVAPLDIRGTRSELSDHYGVHAELRIQPLP